MNNNFNNQNNNPIGGFGTTPNSNLNTNQANTNQTNTNTSPTQSNQDGWGALLDNNTQQTQNQPASATNTSNNNSGFTSNYYSSNSTDFNPNTNYSGNNTGFNPNTNYSGNNAGFNPNQTYNNNLNTASQTPYSNTNSNNFANQSFDNQAFNNNQNIYQNQATPLGEDKNKGKSVASLVFGISSCVLLVASVVLFWVTFSLAASSIETSDDTSYGVGLIIALAIPFLSLILGILGIVLGALYHKDANTANVHTNKGKATAGIVFSVISTALSLISAISCIACVSCSALVAEQLADSYPNNYYSDDDFYDYYDDDDYDDDDYDYDYDDFC